MGKQKKKAKEIIVKIDLKEQFISIHIDDNQVSTIMFMFDETQITVSDVTTEVGWKRKGYGKLAFEALKMIAQQRKMPIYLWSLPKAFKFYEKIGFLHLNDPKVQNKIIFGNLPTKQKILEEIDDDDFVWLPQHLNGRKPIIYV